MKLTRKECSLVKNLVKFHQSMVEISPDFLVKIPPTLSWLISPGFPVNWFDNNQFHVDVFDDNQYNVKRFTRKFSPGNVTPNINMILVIINTCIRYIHQEILVKLTRK